MIFNQRRNEGINDENLNPQETFSTVSLWRKDCMIFWEQNYAPTQDGVNDHSVN